MDELARLLFKRLKITEVDATFAAFLAIFGFLTDVFFFPGGLTAFQVTALCGAVGLLLSKWYRNRPAYVARLLRNLDKLVAEGHLTPEQAAEWKIELQRSWLDRTEGVALREKRKRKQINKASEPSEADTE